MFSNLGQIEKLAVYEVTMAQSPFLCLALLALCDPFCRRQYSAPLLFVPLAYIWPWFLKST